MTLVTDLIESIAMSDVRLKRAYDAPAANDGCRVLVDGMWPRGVAKADANIDLWLKELAPSADLRKWFDHDPAKWAAFQDRYRDELADGEQAQAFARLHGLYDRGRVTLVYAAKNRRCNNAVVLKQSLQGK